MKSAVFFIALAVLLGAGYWWWSKNASEQANKPRVNQQKTLDQRNAGASDPAAKSGTTTKTGEISKQGDRYYIEEAGQSPKEVDSYAVDLGMYLGQTVTVSGQYSGDTLFVGSVE